MSDVARLEATALGVEILPDDAGDAGERVADAGDLHQRAPLPGGQRDDHHAPAVAGLEVVTEGAVEVVAVLRVVAAGQGHLGDPAEVADHREGDVGEGE